jgi:tetratricopeptide (TPR) repeat protein
VAAVRNQITGETGDGIVVQARDIGTVYLSTPVPVALAGLPAEVGFTGRVAELEGLVAGLVPDRGGVSVVAGLAGVGKTALAVRAANQVLAAGWFPGGVLFIDLHGYDGAGGVDPSAAVASLLGALGVTGDRVPSTQGEREVLYRSELAALAARGRRVLVVADNASTLPQVLALRPGHPAHCLIVTSRHTLPVPGARRVELDVLSEADAIGALASALRAAGVADRRVDDEPAAAAALASLCGYLPLALRIAAELLADKPWQPIGDLVSLFTSVRDRLGELAYGDSVAVRVAFDTSYRRLPAEQARLFLLAALHPGMSVSVESVAAMAGLSEVDARHGIDEVRRAHLVQFAAVNDTYRFHDLVRLYAVRHGEIELTQQERDEAIDRLLDHYRDAAQAANTHVNPRTSDRSPRFAGRDAAMSWLENERPNLVAVITTAAGAQRDAHVRDIAFALPLFFVLRKHRDEWVATITCALAACRRLGDRHGEATALNSLGVAYQDLRRFEQSQDCHQRALVIFSELGDRHGEGLALTNLGNIHHERRQWGEAADWYLRSLPARRAAGDRYGEGQTLNNLGITYALMGRPADAADRYRQALVLFRELGDRHGEGTSLTNLGATYQAARRWDEALDCHQRALDILRETGDRFREGRALHNMAVTYQDSGRWHEALECHRQALAVRREVGDRYGEGVTLEHLAVTYRSLGRHHGRRGTTQCPHPETWPGCDVARDRGSRHWFGDHSQAERQKARRYGPKACRQPSLNPL